MGLLVLVVLDRSERCRGRQPQTARRSVTYTRGVVNRHQIELYLLDPSATVTAAWTQRQWDESVITAEAAALLAAV